MDRARLDAVDALDARVRRARGRRRARGGRRSGRRGRCRGSTRSPPRRRPGAEALLDALVAEADATWAAPHARRADVLGAEERDEARVAAELRAAAGELRALDPELLGDADGAARRARRGRGAPGRRRATACCSPTRSTIRARRFRAVFVCGLQDGEFPQRPVPEPFLDDEARRALSVAAGLRLPFHEDVLDRERSLFYACVSRPQEVLFLSWRSSDEEGEPLVASPFLDDVRALFTDELWEQRGRRLLAEVTWSPREAPTPRELQRAQAQARNEPDPPPLPAPVSAPVLAQLAERRTEGARQLETFAACGVRWLVEALLHPQRVTPDPEPMRRGSRAHAVLETTLRRLKDATGSAALTPASLPAALRGARRGARRASSSRARAGGRAADARGRPPALPAPRGRARRRARAGAPRVALRPRGRRARPAGARRAVDHRARRPRRRRPGRRGDRARLQGRERAAGRRLGGGRRAAGRALHAGGARAARARAGRRPLPGAVGARVAPARAGARRRAGQLRRAPTWSTRPELEAALDEVRERALETAAALQAGEVRACPEKCSPKGCAYPTICRAGG